MKELSRYFSKDTQIAKRYMKDAKHHYSSKKWTSKLQRYIISYLTGCLLLKNLSIANTEKDVEKRKPLYIFGGNIKWSSCYRKQYAAAAAKSLQSCPILCDPIDSSPPGSPVPGILQARTLEWVAISFSNSWKWKVKVKSLSRVRLLATPQLQPTRLLRP